MESIHIFLLAAAISCAISASASAILITHWLDLRGFTTPFLLMRLFVFRNLARYKEITLSETGKIGSLFYVYVISINAALVLVIVALVLLAFSR